MKSKPVYNPNPIFTELFPGISGNQVNGLGEETLRRPAPFFWHKPDLHPFGGLQQRVTDYHRRSADVRETYSGDADRGPRRIEKASVSIERSDREWSDIIKQFVLEHEGDLVGITPVDPLWVYEGFEVHEPNLVMIGVAMDHARLNQAPADFENSTAAVEVGEKYNQAARVCRELTNYILSMGYNATAFQGPYATALNMIPAAIAAGFGELGKHGSIINREYGSAFRLSAVSTDMPLRYDTADSFGADDFCLRCRVCSNACPPDAIFSDKQMVRGTEKWYVDFDKCIPYFGDTLGCAICIARCPWSTPGRAPRLAQKWAGRRGRSAPGDDITAGK